MEHHRGDVVGGVLDPLRLVPGRIEPKAAVADGRGMVGDDGLQLAEHLLDPPVEQIVEVAQAMRPDVSDHSGAGAAEVVPPGMRQVPVGHEIADEEQADVVDVADIAAPYRLARQDMHRVLDVVEADDGRDALLRRRLGHLPGMIDPVCERLLAIDVLAGLDRRHRHFEVHVVRRADVDDIDRRIVDDLAPVLGGALVAEVARGTFRDLRVDVGYRGKNRNSRLGAERALRRAVGHRMDFSHPPGADQSNPQLSHRCPLPSDPCPAALSMARAPVRPADWEPLSGLYSREMFILKITRDARRATEEASARH